ncbi:MAG: hypothetical protein MZU84_03970 [Sphingobacterium sp.]|nr:hypothetical protein [Sphingobacterium sp.]
MARARPLRAGIERGRPVRRGVHRALGAPGAEVHARRCGAMPATSTGSSARRRTCATTHAALKRGGEVQGYAVYRHLQEARGRVTLLVDFLADPDDAAGIETLLGWVDREAKAANSDKIRAVLPARRLRARAEARRLLPGEVHDGVHGQDQRRRGAGVLLPGHDPGGTSRSATPTRTAEHAVAAGGHRYRGRQPVVGRSPAAPAVREHLRPAPAPRDLPEAPRPPDVSRSRGRSRRTRGPPPCSRSCCGEGTARSAPITTRGRRRRARRMTSGGTRTRCSCRRRSSPRRWHRSPTPSATRSANGRCRTAPGGSASPPPTSPTSSGPGTPSSRASRPLFYEGHKGGPDFAGAPPAPYFLALRRPDRARHEQPAGAPGVGGAQPPRAGVCRAALRAGARGPTRPSASSGSSASRASSGCARPIRRSTTCARWPAA